MQIVIEYPDDRYALLKDFFERGRTLGETQIAILSGKVLPKGHGRLIDADAVEKFGTERMWQVSIGAANMFDVVLHNAQTIIEADKETDNADSN